MIVCANGAMTAGWALKAPDGTLILSDVCGSERRALELRRLQMEKQPQRGVMAVVPVVVTVTECPRG